MSVKHLGPGSVEPKRVDGLLRVYSMVSCPFAKRVRLVVKAKNLQHDIVNIDLVNKPEWYFKIHPKGQVPSLLDGDKIVIESLDIADYLDEKYPTENPLYPKDPVAKQKDKEVIRNLGSNAISALFRFTHSLEGEQTPTAEQAVQKLLPSVQPLEDELARRKTPFFGESQPGMIDYMLWPWAELLPILYAKLGVKKLPLTDEQIPALRKWAKLIAEVPVVKELFVPPEVVIEYAEARRNNTVNFDEVAKKIPANAVASL